MKTLRNLIMYFNNLSIRYSNIIADPERRENSKYFGIISIINSILGAVIVALCAFGISALMENDSIVSIVFIVLLALMIVVALFEFTLRGIIATVYQRKVNKHPIGIAAIVIWIATFIAAVVLSVIMIAKVIG